MQRGEVGKASLCVALLGHSGSGKSVLGGQMGVKSGTWSQREADKMTKVGAASPGAQLAFLVDRTGPERVAGRSRQIGRFCLELPDRRLFCLVCPGGSDSLAEASRAISAADVGVLVLDANAAELEASLDRQTGMALDHVLLAYALGIQKLIVVVNKMDSPTINFAASRFEEIRTEILAAVKKAGYQPDHVVILPASALLGENVTEAPPSMPWYRGPSLLEALAQTPIPPRNVDAPLRFVVRAVYRGNVSAGKVEQGVIRVGQVVTMAPRMITTTVESLQVAGKDVEQASAGDMVGVVLKDVDAAELDRAAVIGDAKNPPRICAQFVARVVPLSGRKIRVGYSPVVYCHMGMVPCVFAKLLSKQDKKDKKKMIQNPEFLDKGESGFVLLVPLRPFCFEPFDLAPTLGRFAVRDNGKTQALGKIQICTPDDRKKMLIPREHMERLDKSHRAAAMTKQS